MSEPRRTIRRKKSAVKRIPRKLGRPPGSGMGLRCQCCNHPEAGRINFLIANGGSSLLAISKKFGLSYQSLRPHARYHITQAYKDAVRASPLQSLAGLQKIAAENGTSVFDGFMGIYSALQYQFLRAFEAGDNQQLCMLAGKMHQNLRARAEISREILPSGATITNTYNSAFMIPGAQELLAVLLPYPEARAAIVRHYEQRRLKEIEHVPVAAE